MNTIELYQIVSIVAFSLAGILFISAILMFFKLDIPAVIGDLNGKNAQRQIEEIRKQSAETRIKQYRVNSINKNDEVATEEIYTKTEKMRVDNEDTELLQDDTGTQLLSEDEGTMVLMPEDNVGDTQELSVENNSIQFELIKNIISINTQEIIC